MGPARPRNNTDVRKDSRTSEPYSLTRDDVHTTRDAEKQRHRRNLTGTNSSAHDSVLLDYLSRRVPNPRLGTMELAPLLNCEFSYDQPLMLFEYKDGRLGVKLSDLLKPQVENMIENGSTIVSTGDHPKSNFLVEYYDLPITKAQKYANRTRKGDKTGITLAKMGQQASEVMQDYFKNIVRKTRDEFNPFRLGTQGRAFNDLYLVALVPMERGKHMYSCVVGLYPEIPAVTASVPPPFSPPFIGHEHASGSATRTQAVTYVSDTLLPQTEFGALPALSEVSAVDFGRASTLVEDPSHALGIRGSRGTITRAHRSTSGNNFIRSFSSLARETSSSAPTHPPQHAPFAYPTFPGYSAHQPYDDQLMSQGAGDFGFTRSQSNDPQLDSGSSSSGAMVPPGQSVFYTDPDPYPLLDELSLTQHITLGTGYIDPVILVSANDDNGYTVPPDGQSRSWTY